MSRLNFHHLHYFWAVAKDGNLTRAAEKLHVSQSALSKQIRLLEEQLGQPLFARAGRTLKLTEAGHQAVGYADTIFASGNRAPDFGGRFDQTRREWNDDRDPIAVPIWVGEELIAARNVTWMHKVTTLPEMGKTTLPQLTAAAREISTRLVATAG